MSATPSQVGAGGRDRTGHLLFGRQARSPLRHARRNEPPQRRIGGEYRDRTCASVRIRRVSTALPLPLGQLSSSGGDGALDWTRTSTGPFRTRLTVRLVDERMPGGPGRCCPGSSRFCRPPRSGFATGPNLAARTGVEPVWTDSESVAWPIGQATIMVSVGGFEPPIPCFQGRWDGQAPLRADDDWPSRQDSNLHTFAFVARYSSS